MMGAKAKRTPALQIIPRLMGESLLLRVEGKLTVATVPIFSSAVATALHSNARAIIVDLRELTDIDARGVGELVKAHTLGQSQDRPVRFLIRNGRVARLIRLANLNKALTLLEDARELNRFEVGDESRRFPRLPLTEESDKKQS
ncbi:MAG: STAS domain-containing protein [Blastocatellia bacterium]|nr:STAS domain-containing protein [Blastocatellia bacterium]